MVHKSSSLPTLVVSWDWRKGENENFLFHGKRVPAMWNGKFLEFMYETQCLELTLLYYTLESESVNPSCPELCPALCDSMDCSPSVSSVHRILQARYWGGLPFPPRGHLPDPGNWTWVFCIVGRLFTIWATREARSLDSESRALIIIPRDPRAGGLLYT